MAAFEKPEQTVEGGAGAGPKRRGKTLPLAVIALLAALALGGALLFYRYMESTLFQERNLHFIEISDKVSQLIESAVSRYRAAADTAEYLLAGGGLQGAEDLPGQLEEIQACLGLKRAAVLAVDSGAQLYTSGGGWQDAPALLGEGKRQELVTALSAQAQEATHILFLNRLTAPLAVGERQITHVGVAVELSVFQENFDASLFQGRSHVYVIGPDGSRLYRHLCLSGFIDRYNLLTALEDYAFLHGGEPGDLRAAVESRTSAGYEFQYGEEPYFVAVSPVHQTDWSILTFVPTEVLGAKTTAFMNRTVGYVSAIAAAVVLLTGLLIFFFAAKRADRRLILQQQRANLLLQKAADAANAANAAKSNFLSHMSHDIRTPINGIMGMADIALKNLGDRDRVLDCLRKIEGSSGHLLSLVNDVLDMSRIESGKTQVSHEPMDLRQVAEHCASIIGGQLQGRDVELVEQFEPLAHPHVLGDALHLRQVLINILGNAVKFTPDGGKIYFRMQELSSEGGGALYRLEVEDTGIGMKPEFLPHLFEPFAQEDDGMHSRYKGTGLGMAITKQFVELMGGSIAVESRLHVGSRFCVELPLEIDREIQGTQQAQAGRMELTGVRLLLAEDNELNMEIAQYVLGEAGVEITPAADGREALEAFSSSPPGTFDGILMDVRMPEMDGLAATQAIRALERADAKTIPIIAMTANAYEEDRLRCLKAGMNDHIPKPVNGEALLQILARYVQPDRPAVRPGQPGQPALTDREKR